MTDGDWLGLNERLETLLIRGLQTVLAALAVYGLVTGHPSVAVNGAGSLAVTMLPAILRRDFGLNLGTDLVLWLTVAALLHTVGVAGPYQTIWWWDYLTHALAAGLVAGVGYAVLRTVEQLDDDLRLPEPGRSVAIFIYVAAFAVLWELLEVAVTVVSLQFMAKSVLVIYGADDMATDLLFSMIGGVLVILWGRGYFRDVSRHITRVVAAS